MNEDHGKELVCSCVVYTGYWNNCVDGFNVALYSFSFETVLSEHETVLKVKKTNALIRVKSGNLMLF